MWPFRKKISQEEKEREFLLRVMQAVSNTGEVLNLQPPKSNLEAKVLQIIESILKEVEEKWEENNENRDLRRSTRRTCKEPDAAYQEL